MRCKRVVVSSLGGPEVLEIVEEEIPEPQHGEVRVQILAAGVSYADLLMREGVHPETPSLPFTLGWDLVGLVEKLGEDASRVETGQMVAALTVTGGYTEFICLPQEELVPVPAGLDPGEAVSLVLNYLTAYQMMHRSARVVPGQRVLIHSAAGGVGTALLQLGQLVDLKMYGTASLCNHEVLSRLGASPIDYKNVDFVEEILRQTGDGVDVVFDGIGGSHIWHSVKALRARGRVVVYGLTSTLSAGRLPGGRRHRLRGLAIFGVYIVATAFLRGKKRMIPYSIQTLKRHKPSQFREDLATLLELLREEKIKPIIAERIPLVEAARAHELLGAGSVQGRIILLCNQ